MFRWALVAVAAVLIACANWPRPAPAPGRHVMTMDEITTRIGECYPPHPVVGSMARLAPPLHHLAATRLITGHISALQFVVVASATGMDDRVVHCLVMGQRRSV